MMKILILIFIVINQFNSMAQSEETWNWIDSIVNVINNQIGRKEYIEANTSADRLLTIYSGKEAHLLKAQAIMEGRKYFVHDIDILKTANYHLDRSIELDSSYYLAYGRKGLLYFTFRDFEKSIEYYSIYIEKCKDSTELFVGYTDRGSSKFYNGNINGAIDDYYRAKDYDSTHHSIFQNLGSFLIEANRTGEAENILIEGAKLYPDDIGILNNLGFLLLTQEKYQQAIGYFTSSIEREPNDYLALGNRGYCKMKTGDLVGAKTDLDSSESINSGNAYLYKYFGQYYLENENIPMACSMFQKAIKLDFTKIYGNEVNDLISIHCK
jgi:tetratricopeptide (TPR) repeat protein